MSSEKPITNDNTTARENRKQTIRFSDKYNSINLCNITNYNIMRATIFQTSWFTGETIKTTPQKLINLAKKLDAPYLVNNTGDDKTNFDFDFEASDGSYFTVYDWKEYRPLKLNDEVSFHIGGNNRTNIESVLNELKNELS